MSADAEKTGLMKKIMYGSRNVASDLKKRLARTRPALGVSMRTQTEKPEKSMRKHAIRENAEGAADAGVCHD